MLNVPKNIASSSVFGIAALAIALNCQPAMVVASADSRTRLEIARRYGEPATIVRLLHRPPDARAPPVAG